MAPPGSGLHRRVATAASVALLFASVAACSRKAESSGPTPDPSAAGSAVSVIPAIPAIPAIPEIPEISMPLNVAEGHVESSGSTGAWKFDTGKCWAGDNDGYFGVRIESKESSGAFIKLVKDPIKGWTLLASIQPTCTGNKCAVQVFQPGECKSLDVNLKAYTFQRRGTHQFDGDVTFDCTHDKAHVRGKVAVQRCIN